MKVCYIFRQKEKKGHSIENVFNTVNQNVKQLGIETEVYFRNNSLWKSFKEMKRLKSDIYHITGDVYYLALLFPRKRTTLTIHDIGAFKNNKKTLKQYVFAFIWFVLPLWWVKNITVISELVKQDLIKYFSVNPAYITVIENPISLELTFNKKEQCSPSPTILQIGTGWHKNLIGLIEAVRGVDCTLSIIGNPSVELQDLMKKYEVKYQTYANITNDEVIELYAACDLVYFASFSEGFGLPIIEAQKIGRPVITSHLSPMKEVGGEGVLCVDPQSSEEIKKAILQLVENADLYRDCIEKGVINAQKYSPENIAGKYKKYYELLLKENVG